jgi:hypothetical protein
MPTESVTGAAARDISSRFLCCSNRLRRGIREKEPELVIGNDAAPDKAESGSGWPRTRKSGKVDESGQFRGPGAVTNTATGIECRDPQIVGNFVDCFGHRIGPGEPDWGRRLAACQIFEECIGAAGTIGSDQHFLPDRAGCSEWKLRQCLSSHADVVGRGIRSGVSGSKEETQGFSGPVGAVVDER